MITNWLKAENKPVFLSYCHGKRKPLITTLVFEKYFSCNSTFFFQFCMISALIFIHILWPLIILLGTIFRTTMFALFSPPLFNTYHLCTSCYYIFYEKVRIIMEWVGTRHWLSLFFIALSYGGRYTIWYICQESSNWMTSAKRTE